MRNWNVIEHQRVSCTLSLDGSQDDYPAQISTLLAALPVQDVEIRNPAIESIIKDIYLLPAV